MPRASHGKTFRDVERNVECSGIDTRASLHCSVDIFLEAAIHVYRGQQRDVKPVRPDRLSTETMRAADARSKIRYLRYDGRLRQQGKEEIVPSRRTEAGGWRERR